ncbi:GNAT family N-acetyltransferase [Aquamicrobium sp. LC103]|uniref:GNAT family N-acetyltransferase n=1 Tax=Aquamicrobium sp. LC103 TaxID=1120658 RepID=UPI00063EC9C3|nr:GNAT family N-acetyltransferase [Aquamicrobium sp. LC103]TKT78431.1 GNAT family N-acetyltransferase [Aquamicrobium sp. LC103]
MIRPATSADKLPVLRMARDFHAASGMPFRFYPAFAEAIFKACLEDDDRLCLVLDLGGARGVLAAQAAPHSFGPVKVATETMWWIDPAHRGRWAGKMLAPYEAWAHERGCAFINMVGLGSDPLPATLYQRRGYVAAETHFIKPL